MIHLLQARRSGSLPARLREVSLEGGMEPEEVADFAAVSSEFYPELEAHYAKEAAEWLEDCLGADFENIFSRY